MLPPESLPIPIGDPPAAMIAASPLLLPPGDRWRLYGFRVPPCIELALSSPMPPGGQFVLPIMIAPAARIRATTVASRVGTFSASLRNPAVVTTPAVSKMSFTVNGTPWRGPTFAPREMWRSAARAWMSALCPSVRTTAFRCGLIAPICSMCALTISSDEIRPDRMAFAIHVAEAPITFRRRRRLFATSDDVAGLGASDFPGSVAHPREADLGVQRHAFPPSLRTRGR